MKVSTYVSNKLKSVNAESISDRLYGNLAVASIHRSSEVTADAKKAIDALIDRLSKRIGTTAEPQSVEQKEPKQSKTQSVFSTNTKALMAGIDPATGEKLVRIKLLGGDVALHNPSTRVVHPIPGSENMQAYI